MRPQPLSNCEKEFILNSFAKNTRIDGRKCNEFRNAKVIVGTALGSSIAMIGQSKVSVQVSCSIVEPPSASRGNIGLVEVQVDMSPIASPEYEDGRLGAKGIELMRILELLYRDCGVIDLEALCLRAFKQVWQIRVDVHVLDADGSLIDCASLASLTALSHFRRPEVTVLSDSIIVHRNDEEIPIPLNIYHMPICVTFGIVPETATLVIDPTEKEEQCLKGTLVIAANKRHEICNLHQSGNFSVTENLIVQCVDLAIQRAVDTSELISSVIADDNIRRSKRDHIEGFSSLISLNVLTSHQCEANELIAPAVKIDISNIGFENLEDVYITSNRVEIGSKNEAKTKEKDSELLKQIEAISELSKYTENEQQTSVEMQEIDDLLDNLDEGFGIPD